MLLGRRLVTLAVGASVLWWTGAAVAGGNVRTAHTFGGIPQVGAIFPTSVIPEHICTASVVRSPQADLLITAAHCIIGTGLGYSFSPGFHDGISPYGKWSVTAAYVAPGWLRNRDPREDFAFLVVAPRRIGGRLRSIQQLTGGLRLGSTPRPRQRVTVPAYPMGTSNDPITCRARVYFTGPYPSFNCNPYVGGTSGAPWIAGTGRRRRVVGVLGGRHQGGCYPYTSYSSPLGAAARQTYRAAVSGARADIVPPAGSDGC